MKYISPILILYFAILLRANAQTEKTREFDVASLVEASSIIQQEAVKNQIPSRISIPKKYWPPAIHELSPVDVYTDGANVAIVLKRTLISEKGVYISPQISSHIPQSGGDWTFTLDRGFYRFTRQLKKAEQGAAANP